MYKNTITLKRNNSIATLFFNKNCNNIYHLLKTFPDNEIMELDEELLKSLGNKIWEFDGVYKNWNTYNELIDKIPYTNHHTNIVFSIFNINKDFSLLYFPKSKFSLYAYFDIPATLVTLLKSFFCTS